MTARSIVSGDVGKDGISLKAPDRLRLRVHGIDFALEMARDQALHYVITEFIDAVRRAYNRYGLRGKEFLQSFVHGRLSELFCIQ